MTGNVVIAIIDDEKHFILLCDTFKLKRQCFVSRVKTLFPQFDTMSIDEKLRFILCPLTVHLAKCMSKYLVIMANIRKEIDMGLSPTNSNLLFKTCKVDIAKLSSSQVQVKFKFSPIEN